MLRITSVLVLLLVGAISLPMEPTTVASQNDGLVGLYRNTTEGFSIRLPRGWVGQENENNFPLLSIEPRERSSPIIADVWVYRRQDDRTAESWLDAQLAQYDQHITHDSGRHSLPGADSAHQSVYNWLLDDGTIITELSTVIARGSQIFWLRVATIEDFWPSVESQANSFTDSFTLETPMPFGVSRNDSLFQYWGEIVTIDPALSRSGPGAIEGAIFSGLVKLNTDLEVVADLAHSWDVSPNQTVFTFTLRENARFHNGRPVTAEDFKYSWERALHPATESPVARTYLGDIVGAYEMAEGRAENLEGVKVLDPRTLEVTIEAPFPYFLGKLTYPTSYVVDRGNVENGEDWTDTPNGTGAFRLKEWQKDELLILERNDDWYGGTPALAHSVYRIFAGRPMQLYENGEIDISWVYLWDIDRARDPDNALNPHLREGTQLCTTYLGFNVTQPPFHDLKVRQALALALETDKEIEVTLQGLDKRAAGFVPPGMPGHNERLEPSDFDPRAAKRLLESSSYRGAENLPPIRSYSSDDAIHWAWEEHLGLEVEAVSVYEYSDWLERMDNKEFGVFTWVWCADYPDPQNFLDFLFHSDSHLNRFNYTNETVDRLLSEAAVESEDTRRITLYQRAEKIILDDWVAVPLWHDRQFLLVRPYVKGFVPAPIGVPQLQNISIERQR